MKAQDKLLETGVRARVVSMPSWEIFAEQPAEYRQSVLPAEIKGRLAVEAGSGLGWHRWVGDHGEVISIDRFGMSAPGGEVMSKFGFNVENVVERATALVNALK
jgi:transketolase